MSLKGNTTAEKIWNFLISKGLNECGAMAWIKTTKERRQDRKWLREDQDREERLQNEAGKEDSHEP